MSKGGGGDQVEGRKVPSFNHQLNHRNRRNTDRDVGVTVDAVVVDDQVDLLVTLVHVAAVAQTPNVCKESDGE